MSTALRSVGAVVAGFVAMAVIVVLLTTVLAPVLAPGVVAGEQEQAPPLWVTVNLLYSLAAAAVGGWLAARIGAHAPLAYGVALAVLAFGMSAVSGFQPQPGQPSWYGVVIAIVAVAGVLGGAWLRARQA